MIFSLLFVLLLIDFQVQAENPCNDDCLTKTYCISSDGSAGCSNNNLVEAKFKVIPVSDRYDYLQLILKGFNVASEAEKTIEVSIDGQNFFYNQYICTKSSQGATIAKFQSAYGVVTAGSSYYSDSVLYCNWTFNIDDAIWPLAKAAKIDLIKDKSQPIRLIHDSQQIKVAADTSELPIYHAQYLKCCNKVHGNDALALTFDQVDNQIHYRFYYFKYIASRVTFILTNKDGIKIQFDFILHTTHIDTISKGDQSVFISNQIMKPFTINNEIFTWSTPYVLGDATLSIDASSSVFDLEIQIDSVKIYTEKGVSLKNSSNLFKSSFILTTLTLAFQILSIYVN